MPTAQGIVRSQGLSGKHMLALRFSAFDPEGDMTIDKRALRLSGAAEKLSLWGAH
jgi:hypothetical protein